MRITTAFVVGLVAGLGWSATSMAAVPRYHFEVIASYPHDPHAYTQGLLWFNGYLFESTGLEGRSTVRRVRLGDGAVLQQAQLADHYFGEGLAQIGDRLFQLTWKAGTGFVYDVKTLQRLGMFHYRGQGWGLAWDGEHLIMSDGSAMLRFLDPQNFKVVARQRVTLNGIPIRHLNELEMVAGELWANVYLTDFIVRINPASGQVVGVIDASDLRQKIATEYKPGVLNGIAYDAKNNRIFVTGKLWPHLFQVRPVPTTTP